jgi:hypothetical protein
MDDTDRLIGPVLKIQRASEHLGDLYARHRYFGTPHPYGIYTERDEEAKVVRYRFHLYKTIPPEWSLIIGDLLHNLRSALDLIAWQLVEANGNRPDEHTKFPIGESEKAWESGESGAKILQRKGHAIGDEPMAVLRTLKPYKGGDDALYALHRLNIEDKHHLLIPAYGARIDTVLVFPNGRFIPLWDSHHGPPTVLEEGTVLATMPFDTEGEMKPQFLIDIALGEAPVAGKEMLPMLTELASQVDGVLKAFGRFLQPPLPPAHLQPPKGREAW